MSSSRHEKNEHAHDRNDDHVHDHHHHSMRTNKLMGHTQIIIGTIFMSFSLVAAGVHNELDSPVHKLRGKAEHSTDPRKKLMHRLKAGALMIGGAAGVFVAERYIPVDTVKPVAPILFGVETIVNGHNSLTHYRSDSDSHDTRIGLGHNALDTGSSLAAFALTSSALALGSSGNTAEYLVGYGHVGAMSSLGLISIVSALHDFKQSDAKTPEQEMGEIE